MAVEGVVLAERPVPAREPREGAPARGRVPVVVLAVVETVVRV